jgi:predicted transglutaminase-like cysteine proteinase
LCHGGRSGKLDDGQALRVLQQVNRYVNASVTPVEEPGKSFYWSTSYRGDCKNYALLKMRTLINVGFPSSKLALSVVLDRSGNNHMVLLARLNSGDYVLDNLSSGVKSWYRTGYTFLASQNFKRKGSWQVTLAGPRSGQFYED